MKTLKFNYKSTFVSIFLFLIFVFLYFFITNRIDLIKNILVSIVFFISLIIPGFAILSLKYFRNNLNTLEKFVFSFGVSIAVCAVFSLIIFSFFYNQHKLLIFISFILINLFSIGVLLLNYKKKRVEGFNKKIIYLSTIFIFFIIFIQTFLSLPFLNKEVLQDGPYVFKNNNLHVKMQTLTGDLPADNFVPYVFSQFLIQHISFEKNRPMLPGQEVSNRTQLMGLEEAYFLSMATRTEKAESDQLGTFSYVGSQWPDVQKLGNDNKSFQMFLNFGIVLNSIFIFSLFLLIYKYFGKYKAFAVVLLFLLFPYTINQVIFTWPKFLMAYFLIAALYLFLQNKKLVLGSFFLGLAFQAHPSSLAFSVCIILYWFLNNFKVFKNVRAIKTFNFKELMKKSLLVGIVLGLVISPWIIWTGIILKIPSDVIAQNIATANNYLGFIVKLRLDNLFNLFLPWQLQDVSLTSKLFKEMTFSLAGAVGIFYILTFYYAIKYLRKYYLEIILLAIAPIVILSYPWGTPVFAFSVLFCQPTIPVLFGITSSIFSRNRFLTVCLIFLQVVLSIYVVWFGMYNITKQRIAFDLPNGLILLLILLQILCGILGVYLLIKKERNNFNNYKNLKT